MKSKITEYFKCLKLNHFLHSTNATFPHFHDIFPHPDILLGEHNTILVILLLGTIIYGKYILDTYLWPCLFVKYHMFIMLLVFLINIIMTQSFYYSIVYTICQHISNNDPDHILNNDPYHIDSNRIWLRKNIGTNIYEFRTTKNTTLTFKKKKKNIIEEWLPNVKIKITKLVDWQNADEPKEKGWTK